MLLMCSVGGRCTRKVSVCVSGWISSKRGLSAEAASAALLILPPERTAKNPAQLGYRTGKAGATAAVTQSWTSSAPHATRMRVQHAQNRCGTECKQKGHLDELVPPYLRTSRLQVTDLSFQTICKRVLSSDPHKDPGKQN